MVSAMTTAEFKKYVEGVRPAFSRRVRMTEQEFKRHIKDSLGVSLGNSGDKTYAQKINEIRRFFFKIVVD